MVASLLTWRHQTAGLAVGEEGERKRTDGVEDRFLQVVYQLGGDLGGNNAVDQRDEQRNDAHADNQQHHFPDFAVEAPALGKHVVIEDGVGYVRRQHAECGNHHEREHHHRDVAAIADEHPAQPLDQPHLVHAFRTDLPLGVGVAHSALGAVMVGFGFLAEFFLVHLPVAQQTAVGVAEHVRVVPAGVGEAEQLGLNAVVFADGQAAADERLHMHLRQLFLFIFRIFRLGEGRFAVPRVGQPQPRRPADDDRALQHAQPVGEQRDVNVLEHQIAAEVGAHGQQRRFDVEPALGQPLRCRFRQLLEYDHCCLLLSRTRSDAARAAGGAAQKR